MHSQLFRLKLKSPLNLKRRVLTSSDPNYYQGELIAVSNMQGQTGYGEVVGSRKLAEELACLHLTLLETHFKWPNIKIPVAAMLESIQIQEAQKLVAEGFQTLKFKIGPNWAQDAELLSEVRLKVGHHIDIRLDANQRFDLKTAVRFGKRVSKLGIAYFEEPLRNILEIPEFVQRTGIWVALDESLIPPFEQRGGEGILEGVSTYALKPFLMPDLESIFSCIQFARQHQIKIAICSAFESGYGLTWLAFLAALIQEQPMAAGLSTYRWFAEDLIRPAFSVVNGCALFSQLHEPLFHEHASFLLDGQSDLSKTGL